MAISTKGYVSNAIVGQPMAGADIDIYEVNSTPKYAIGFGFTRSDGNCYRYCQFSKAGSAGQVWTTDSAYNITTANACTAPASAVDVSGDNIDVGAKGSRYLELTGILVSANQLQGSYMNVYGGTGMGYTYRVKGNTLTGSIGSGLTRVQLYEPLELAIAADTDLMFAFNPYANLDTAISTAASSNIIAGVSCADISTADYFGWVCEKGIIGAWQSADMTVGIGCCVGVTAGTVDNYTKATAGTGTLGANPIIGKCIMDGGAGAMALIRLNGI